MLNQLDGVLLWLPAELQRPTVLNALQFALAEDVSPDASLEALLLGDVTSAAVMRETKSLIGRVVAKTRGVVAGLPVAAAVFALVSSECVLTLVARDGQQVEAGDELFRVRAPGRALLTAERTALNFLGRMSGIATLTRRYVDAVAGTGAIILDTRKTAPGLRWLDKYAVRMGGGQNHRMGLYDMVLIKDNHIDAAGSITAAVERVQERYSTRYPIEVEVKNLVELREALALHPDRIMLDNMTLDVMRQAVEIAAGRVPLEASGNVSLETVRAIAETGVDFISVGALTHSAPALDVSMRLE